MGLRSSRFSSSGASPSSPSTAAAANISSHSSNEEEATTTSPPTMQPKPKPLPKPRPWSIVGVDRKTGDLTSVSGESEKHKLTSSISSTGGNSSAASAAAAQAAASRKSSVRDLINNMNKGGGDGPTPAPRKGASTSLPRGVTPPTRSVAEEDEDAVDKEKKAEKTKSKTECTSDDPRILKLDDDFAYDEVLDV